MASADELGHTFPFPRVSDIDNKSPAELRKTGFIPPTHGKCRCETIFLWRKTTVTTDLPADFDAARAQFTGIPLTQLESGQHKTEAGFYKAIFNTTPAGAKARLRKVIDDSDIYMAMPAATFRRQIVAKPGAHFKNSLETGKGAFKTIGEDRAKKEAAMFGIKAQVDDYDKWPKYGFLSHKGGMQNDNIPGFGYGDSYVKFKRKNLAHRTTFTLGDSYDGNIFKGDRVLRTAPPTKLTNVDEKALRSYVHYSEDAPFVKKKLHAARTIDQFSAQPYPEAQIYGRLTLDDVESVSVTSIKEAKLLKAALKKAGREDIEVLASRYDERLELLWGRDYSKKALSLRASLTTKDIDRLGDDWMDKLGVAQTLAGVHKTSRGTMSALKKPWNLPGWISKDDQAALIKWSNRGKDYEQKIPIDVQRRVTRAYYKNIPLKEKSGLIEAWYKDYSPTKAGWMDDVFKKKLLTEGYYPHGAPPPTPQPVIRPKLIPPKKLSPRQRFAAEVKKDRIQITAALDKMDARHRDMMKTVPEIGLRQTFVTRFGKEKGERYQQASNIFVRQWKGSSSSKQAGILKHMAERNGFGNVVYHEQFLDKDVQRIKKFRHAIASKMVQMKKDFPGVDFNQMFRIQYAYNQEMMARKGIETVQVYRGIGRTSLTRAGTDMEKLNRGEVVEGRLVSNPISSWTSRKETAKVFGSSVMSSEVPVSNVWMSKYGHSGFFIEEEMTILGGESPLQYRVKMQKKFRK